MLALINDLTLRAKVAMNNSKRTLGMENIPSGSLEELGRRTVLQGNETLSNNPYDKRALSGTLGFLDRSVGSCRRSAPWRTSWWIRNDMAHVLAIKTIEDKLVGLIYKVQLIAVVYRNQGDR